MAGELCDSSGIDDSREEEDYMASSAATEMATNFCYPNHQSLAAMAAHAHHLVDIHDIPPGYDPAPDTIFSNMSQNLNLVGLGNKNGLMGDSGNWQDSKLFVDETSMRCVFPCEGNERPSQGLSLSLSSADPSSIGLQPFELRPADHNQDHQQIKFGASSSSDHNQQQLNGSLFGKSAASMQGQVGQLQPRSSKYLRPVQELLNEFCSLETNSNNNGHTDQTLTKHKVENTSKQPEDDNGRSNLCSSSTPKSQSLTSLEFMELQNRKTKLLILLEEVDRRYRHYCDQMKAVVSSFEIVAGHGAATVYSALALKAMSRHFRCLRDGIVNQIKETKKAVGEKDPAAPGTSRGETPRLKVIDQALRQQRAFQQMNMMESHPWRPQRGLPERSVSVLRAWLFEHFLHPYPSDVDKHILARQTGLSRSQVSNWFINARVRLWKPMVEEMYMEETKVMGSSEGATDLEDGDGQSQNDSQSPNGLLQSRLEDQKLAVGLVRIDSECLSSIITSPGKREQHYPSKISRDNNPRDHHDHNILHPGFGRVGDGIGAMELDFSSYNHHSASSHAAYGDKNMNHFNGAGVSLTLGLQQQRGSGGMSVAFSPTSQGSLFYPRDHVEECHPIVQYPLLDGEGQNLQYRNLMGAQLLHDMAG